MIFAMSAFGNVVYVPDSISTIQQAINFVNTNDTIIVKNGTYKENIDFDGKNLTLASQYFINGNESHITNTIISGNDSGSVVIYDGGEDSTSILMGIIIKNGKANSTTNFNGGGIYCKNSNPNLSHLIIENNVADSCGGGIYFNNSDAICENITLGNDTAKIFGGAIYLKNSTQDMNEITILNNSAEKNGAGFYIENSNLVLARSIISENNSTNSGGGFFINNSSCEFENCLITDNQIISGDGSAINSNNSSIEITNNTIANNELFLNTTKFICKNSIIWDSIYAENDSVTITYSDVIGGWSGEGNLNILPYFIAADSSDYHLSDYSYCIGMGTNDISFGEDIEGNVRPNPTGSYVDIGAYENSRKAPINSENIYHISLDGNEINGNGSIDRPFSQIQSGINNAIESDTILIAPGIYSEGISVDKALCIGSHILITGDSTYIDSTIISVDSSLNKSVIQIENTGAKNVIINGLTLKNGKGTYKYPDYRGGGIFCYNTKVQLKNLVISDCSAEYGAGIDFINSEAILNDVVISSNSTDKFGGGISSSNSKLYLFDVDIVNNLASGGGGIYSFNNSILNLQNVNIWENSATKNATLSPNLQTLYKTKSPKSISNYGGGIHCSETEMFLQNTIIAKNNSDGNGSGISCINQSEIKAINTTFYGNSSDANGGAFYLDWDSEVVVANSILWQNSPQEIYLNADSIHITNSDVEGGESGIVNAGYINWLTGNIDSNPNFVGVVNNDYNLNVGSPCENIGTAFFVLEGDTIINLSSEEYSGTAPGLGAFGSSPKISTPTVDIKEMAEIAIPEKLKLFPAYPNPFNPTVSLPYSIPKNGLVKISIYNILGQKIITIVDQIVEEGFYVVRWNGVNESGFAVASGIYFVNYQVRYNLTSSDFLTQKILLLK